MQTEISPSPHLRYFGGRYGRVSLMGAQTQFIEHARDCTQALINVDSTDMPVVVDQQPLLLASNDAILIGQRQSYAIPADARRSANATAGLILIKASSWLEQRIAPHDTVPTSRRTPARLASSRRSLRGKIGDLKEVLTTGAARAEVLQCAVTDVFTDIATGSPGPNLSFGNVRLGEVATAIGQHAEALSTATAEQFANIEGLSRRFQVSRRQFYSLFRQATALTPRAFVNMRRLETAFAMLLDPSRSIASISYELGFSAPPHFTRFMRSNTGWTPSEYRRQVCALSPELRPGSELDGATYVGEQPRLR